MKSLGVIGGLGPLASAYFLELLIEMTDAKTDQEHLDVILFDRPAAAEETRRQQRQRIGDRPEAASAEFGLNFTEVKKMLPFSTRNSTNCCRKENNLEIRLQSRERVDIMGLTRWGHPAGLIPCG